MLLSIKRDIQSALERDPAARNVLEVIFCYPGFHALLFYRVAHSLWVRKLRFLARFISEVGRFFTGIEIHPGAKISPGLFIDHGMGVVIGETSEIGENCTIYQGATLGGTSLKKEKRHPTLGKNVVVGVGAKVLGPFRVGDDSRIGAGSVVINEVPPNSTVVGIPAKVVIRDGVKLMDHKIDLDHANLPDPNAMALAQLLDRISTLERELHSLRRELRPEEETF
ncbi:MAG TPA: serine O-acetyltransferase [bacterium]|nr:serine O-acetyltransferase [bacterium]